MAALTLSVVEEGERGRRKGGEEERNEEKDTDSWRTSEWRERKVVLV